MVRPTVTMMVCVSLYLFTLYAYEAHEKNTP